MNKPWEAEPTGTPGALNSSSTRSREEEGAGPPCPGPIRPRLEGGVWGVGGLVLLGTKSWELTQKEGARLEQKILEPIRKEIAGGTEDV